MAHITNQIMKTDKSDKQFPWLPVELVGQIIDEAWNSTLSTEERIHLYVSLCNVNKTFLDLFIRTALKDVHLMSAPYTEHYLRLIRDRTPAERDDDYLLEGASKLANTLCRSLTIHIDDLSFRSSRLRKARAQRDADEAELELGTHAYNASSSSASSSSSVTRTRNLNSRRPNCIRLYSDNEPSAISASSALYTISMFKFLPNLRHVCIEYVNWGFDDLFDQFRLVVFPSTAEHLEVRFVYTGPVLTRLARRLRRSYLRRCFTNWETPGVRHLTVSGAPIGFVADLVQTCPNVETLEIDEPGSLVPLAPLPGSFRTLKLRMPSAGADSTNVARKWRLAEALDAGLTEVCCDGGEQLKVVVRSTKKDKDGRPLAAWEREKSVCGNYHVQLLPCDSD